MDSRTPPHLLAYSSPATETVAAKKQPPLWLSIVTASLFPTILILSMAGAVFLAMLWIKSWIE